MSRSTPPFFPPRPRKRARANVEWQGGSALDSDPSIPIELSAPKHVSKEGPAEAQGYRAGELLAGKYKLLGTLGQGGMASVWVVQNLVLDAQFALKLILNDGGDANSAERMLREARSAARIEHPAIIRMFDFGVTDRGDPFLVMELLSGMSVRERLQKEGRMTPIEAVRLLLPIADALSVAHARGVIHRDLKPDNIVCVSEGPGRCQAKLIDFGIAKQLDQESVRLTQNGMVLGSPEYMSPEQAQGLHDVDHKADIWAFSVVLYEIVTGMTPFFRAGAAASILHAILEESPRPIADFGIDDPELSSILMRGLQKFPAGRWEDMRSFGTALAMWLLHQGVEEDACAQSVRMVWLRSNPSAPPVAVDPRVEERGRLAALAEDYDVPKKSIARTTLGLAAALLTVALIATAAFFTRGASRPASPVAANQPPPAALDSLAVQQPNDAMNPPLPPAIVPAPSAAVPPATEPPAAETPIVRAPRETPTARATRRLVPGTAKRPAPAPTPNQGNTGETTLPVLLPPPVFADKPSDNPYANDDTAGGKASDNPSVNDGTTGGKASDNPYVDTGDASEGK